MAGDIDREGVEKAYGRWAPVYDLVFGKVFDHGRQSTIAEADKIGGRILDVGVGTGLSLSDYSRTTRLCGVDISEPMLRKAQQRVRALGLTNVETLAVMDAKNLAFPDAFFDAVVAQYVITAVPDPEATLDDFIRVLKPGGELILVNHIGAESGPRRLFELAFAPLARRLGWRPEFPWARLVDWAAKHGGVTLAERRPMPPMGHFSLIRYPQIVKLPGILPREPPRRAGRFLPMRINQSLFLSCVLMAAPGVAHRAGPACAGNPAGPDRAAGAGAVRQLRADAAAARSGHVPRRRARPPASARAARRQAGAIRRRAVPARGRRPGNARADARRAATRR